MAASRSTRRRFDDEGWQPPTHTDHEHADDAPVASLSTSTDAARGPMPAPDWLVTDPRARDID
ncbi:MAG: hypothetical protein ACOYL9_14125, partial [Ilumatobacteraceae bacterium]